MDRATLHHAIKLGLAAALAMVPVRLFDLPSGFWAPLSALAVLQNEIGASFATARNYLFASAIGIGFGTATVIVFGPNVAIAGVGIALVALLCRRLRLPPPTVTTAGGVVPVMVLVAAGDPWRYAAFRLLDVVIGLTTAVLVGALIWPARAGDALRRSVADAVRGAGAYASAAIERLISADVRPADAGELRARMQQCLADARAMLSNAQHEPAHSPIAHGLLSLYLSNCQRIVEHASEVADAAAGGLTEAVLRAVRPPLGEVAASLAAACQALGDVIASGRAGMPLPQARAAAARLGTSMTALETVALSQADQGDELLRLHALVLALKELVRDIRHLVDYIERPTQVPTPSRQP